MERLEACGIYDTTLRFNALNDQLSSLSQNVSMCQQGLVALNDQQEEMQKALNLQQGTQKLQEKEMQKLRQTQERSLAIRSVKEKHQQEIMNDREEVSDSACGPSSMPVIKIQ